MKLHLPKMLTAALIAAFTTVGFTLPQSRASTTYNGVTYSGYIYNVMNTSNHTFHDATFTNYYWNGEAWVNSQQWAGTNTTYYTGTESHLLTGSNNSFWRRNFGDANSGDAKLLGNTIRLASATGNAYYESTFGPYQIGGIIAEAGNDGMYVLGRTGGSCEMRLKAQEGSDFNMYVASNLGLSSNTSITVYNNGTWNVQAGKTLTLAKYTNTGNVGSIANTPSITFAEGVAVTMTGGGTIDMTRTNALNINSGTTINVGANTTVLFASATTLGGTITNAGTVTFGGTVTLTESLVGFEVSGSYVDYLGKTADNGYAGSLDYTIIKGNTDTLTEVTWKGETQTLTNGVMHVDAPVDYTTYHLVKTGASLNLAEEIGHNDKLTAVTTVASTTVNVDTNFTGTISGSSEATINIASDAVFSGTISAGVLTGTGTYELASGTSSMGSVSLDAGWTGTVKLSGITTKNLDLNNYGREGSVVEVDGWASHLNNTDESNIYTYNTTLRLTGDGMTVTDGYSGRTYIFAGGVEGEGDFTYGITTTASDQTYVFTGDVSDWSGAFQASGAGKTSTLKFYGDATDVGADIELNAGTLNLVVGNGEDEFATVFNGEVTASSITVKTDASATFNELHITSAINNSGTVIFNSDLVVTGFQETASEEGYYDLNGAFSSDGNGYSGNSDSYLTIVNGGTVQGEVTVEQDGTDYTMSSDGRALKGDGHVYSYETYYVNDGTVKISDIADSGHGTTAVEVAYGTLDVDRAGSGIDITVTGMATVTGEGLDASQIGIESEAMANFGETLALGGVEFSSTGLGVAVYNAGEDADYSLDNTSMEVSATGITKTIGEDVTVSNWLTVEEITNVQGGKLTLNGMEDAVEVANITVGPDSAVEILSAPETEATITVTEELAAGGGTLLANLVMADDSALLVNGQEKALHMGSTLTMNTNIALDETTLRALDGLANGTCFWLIDAADGHELVYEGPTGEDAWYDSVFSRIAADSDYELNGDFNIVFSDTDGFGLKKFSNTPEPTTGTLSLLALAALAARRRK